MQRVLIFTKDEYLYLKISLEVGDKFDCQIANGTRLDADFIVWDIDSMGAPPEKKSIITVGRGKGAQLRVPFLLGEIEKHLAMPEYSAPLYLDSEARCVIFNGEKTTLTEIEYSLFSALYRRGGSFASRCELNCEVWGREGDGSLLSVYVHYLREKLERRGEKLIISSRKYGYKIDGRYFAKKEEH